LNLTFTQLYPPDVAKADSICQAAARHRPRPSSLANPVAPRSLPCP
jgi:hypothetical protein